MGYIASFKFRLIVLPNFKLNILLNKINSVILMLLKYKVHLYIVIT